MHNETSTQISNGEETPVSRFEFSKNTEAVTDEVQNVPKVADAKIKSPDTPIARLKSVAETLGGLDGSLVADAFITSSFESTKHSGYRKDFELSQTQELADSWGNRGDTHIAYGSEASVTFSIEETGSVGEISNSFESPAIVTLDEVKSIQDHVGGIIQQQVNFDMLNEVREAVYNANFELRKITETKDNLMEESAKDLQRLETFLISERREQMINSVNRIMRELETEYEKTLPPDENAALSSAIKELKIAEKMLKKAGFGIKIGHNEEAIIQHIEAAYKLWPKVRETHPYLILTSFWSELDARS